MPYALPPLSGFSVFIVGKNIASENKVKLKIKKSQPILEAVRKIMKKEEKCEGALYLPHLIHS